MKLISMEIDVEAHLFACLQDGAARAEVKHSLLTKHVDVVNSESPSRHPFLQPRQLNSQNVLCSFCHCFPSEGGGRRGGGGGDMEYKAKIVILTWALRELRSRWQRCL